MFWAEPFLNNVFELNILNVAESLVSFERNFIDGNFDLLFKGE